MLYLVATPIGNLQDISLRAIDTLKSCDYLLCEDTRESAKLLSTYEIRVPLVSFHAHNERARLPGVIDDLAQGKSIALLSDAGTPLLSDPGCDLVRACHAKQIRVCPIPGPSAAVSALIVSTFAPVPFQFLGFLPRKKQELACALECALEYEGTTVCYEAPHRLTHTLETLVAIERTRRICIARELTKTFEEVLIGPVYELVERQAQQPARGEITLVIEGAQGPEAPAYPKAFLQAKVVEYADTYGMSKKEALKVVSREFHVSKNALYALLHE